MPAPMIATSSPWRCSGRRPRPEGCAIHSSLANGKSGPNMVTGPRSARSGANNDCGAVMESPDNEHRATFVLPMKPAPRRGGRGAGKAAGGVYGREDVPDVPQQTNFPFVLLTALS